MENYIFTVILLIVVLRFNNHIVLRFKLFTAIPVNITVLCNVTRFNLGKFYLPFEEIFFLILHDTIRKLRFRSTLKKEAGLREACTTTHRVTSQKVAIFRVIFQLT
jgi:hypothetical protein